MRLLSLVPLCVLLAACGQNPRCTTGASNLKISNSQGGTIYQADAVCASWNTGLLILKVDADVGSDEKLHDLHVSGRVNPPRVGSFSCRQSELGATLGVTISTDRRFEYAGTEYLAGHDPGSQIDGTDCTWEVVTAPASEESAVIAGTFTGRLGRVKTVGDIELIDVTFTYATSEQ